MVLRKTKDLRVAYHNVFGSPEGKKVLADLCKHAPLLKAPLGSASGIDTNRVLVLEGQSNMVKHIYQMLNRDPHEERPEEALNKAIGE